MDLSELKNNMEVLMIAFLIFKLPSTLWRLPFPAFITHLIPFFKFIKINYPS